MKETGHGPQRLYTYIAHQDTGELAQSQKLQKTMKMSLNERGKDGLEFL